MNTDDGRGGPDVPVIADISRAQDIHGDAFKMVGSQGASIVVNHPDLIDDILIHKTQNFSKGPLQQSMFYELLGGSVSMTEGEEHQRLRRQLVPLLSRRAARTALPHILTALSIRSQRWNGQPLDLFQELSDLTIAAIGGTLVNDEALWRNAEFDAARRRVWERMNQLADSDVNAAKEATQGARLANDDDIELLRESIGEALTARMRKRSGDVLSGLADLVHAGSMSRDAAITQLAALLLAAHETNAGALYWAIVRLNDDDGWKSAIMGEVDACLCDDWHDEQVRSFDHLKLIRSATLEALRLYPPAARQFRVSTIGVVLANLDIPAGCPVYISHQALHRRRDVFEDPETFNPGRWVDSPPPSRGFIPFGRGSHRCLGRHYAEFELVVLLALLFRHFNVEVLGADYATRIRIALLPASPAQARISPRMKSA